MHFDTKLSSSSRVKAASRLLTSLSPRAAPQLSLVDESRGAGLDDIALHHPQANAPADSILPIVEIFPSQAVSLRIVTWHGMAVESVQCTGQDRVEFRFRAPIHLLVAYEAGDRRNGDTLVDGLPRSTLRHFAGKLSFVPAGNEFREWHEPRIPARLTYIYFDRAAMHANCEPDIGDPSLAPRLFFEDATLWGTVLKLKRSLEGQTETDLLYAEALGTVLVHELMRFNRGVRRIDPPTQGGLASWQQRAVATYIDEHFAEPISLATLAQLVRLSPHYFCRAFKKSFGAPPHRYHRRCRIERAKTLLVKRGSSVTDTGLTIGFSETSSFSAAFHRETGLTPTEYRRNFA
jgi:AraC family transcriptional regulator